MNAIEAKFLNAIRDIFLRRLTPEGKTYAWLSIQIIAYHSGKTEKGTISMAKRLNQKELVYSVKKQAVRFKTIDGFKYYNDHFFKLNNRHEDQNPTL